MPGGGNPAWCASFSPDAARIVVASDDGAARVWDWRAGRLLFSLTKHSSGVFSATYAPDGKTIVTTSRDRTARKWDAETGADEGVLLQSNDTIWNAAFSIDGTSIALAAGQDGVFVMDEAKHAESARIPYPSQDVLFLGRQRILGVGSRPAVFDIPTLAKVAEYPDLPIRGWSEDQASNQPFAAVAANSPEVVLPGPDYASILWRVYTDKKELIEAARQRAPRQLTAVERAKYFIDQR